MTTFLVIDRRNGNQICECATLDDAVLVKEFEPGFREIQTRRILVDQVVNVPYVRLEDDLRLQPQLILDKSDWQLINLS